MINNSSMQPIYEQIVEQIKQQILQGKLKEGEALSSVRVLAKDLKISALTVKKAYDYLEQEGLIATVHGKGSFVLVANVIFSSFRFFVKSRDAPTGTLSVTLRVPPLPR